MRFFTSLKQKSSHASDTNEVQSTHIEKRVDVRNEQFLENLHRLVPIGKLSTAQLSSLDITAARYETGDVIFQRGEISDTIPYLISGEVYLETASENSLLVQANTFDALHPLSSGDYCNATAICKKNAQVIFVQKVAFDWYRQLYNINPEQLLVLPEPLQQNTVLQRFISAKSLSLPALPDVAIKIRQAIQKDLGVADVSKIISMDPAISAKLIQISNSPIYRTSILITTTLNAVNRIGLHCTKNLVTSISLRSLFRNQRPELNTLAIQSWKKSIRISAFSYVLAKLIRACEPEEALLAGLISNIGVIPFLKFADSLPNDQYDLKQIQSAMPFVCSSISALILDKWNFPDNMKNIPLETRHWYLAGSGNKTDLVDIVLLAKYHSYLGTDKASKLPPITSFPSYAHISQGELTPDKSLKILHHAKQQISDTMRFFTT